MVKYCTKKYPKGSLKNQQTDGRFMEGYLHDNLKILAKAIVKDQTFMGVCSSSTLEVGTGKSVLMTQIGEAWSEIMMDMHGIDIPFTTKNIVWNPKDLIERAFQVPKYSYVLVDEWEDAHYWSDLGMTLRQFFRKCRQLNLFIMIIIPNFFQLNLSYAVSRSVFFIDVRFEEGFARGHFSFYSFNPKRQLYIQGKKTHNYNVARCDFTGKFPDGYGVPEKEYRAAKLLDIKKYEAPENKVLSEKDLRRDIKIDLCKKIKDRIVINNEELGVAFGVTGKTIGRWLNPENKADVPLLGGRSDISPSYDSNTPIRVDNVEDEGRGEVSP